MKAAQAAAKVRDAIKREQINPRGMVSVRSTDYTTEIAVDLRGVRGDARENIESVIDALDGDFGWDVH